MSLRVRMWPREHEDVFVKDRWRLSLCVGNESISFALVSLPSRGGRVGAASCTGCLFASSFIVSLCLLTYVHAILSLLFSFSFVLYSPSDCLPLSPASQPIVFICQSSQGRTYCSCSPYLCFLLFCLFLSHKHSVSASLHLLPSILLRSLCGIQKQKSSWKRLHKKKLDSGGAFSHSYLV